MTWPIFAALLSVGMAGPALADLRSPRDAQPFQIAVTPADSSDLLKFGDREMLTTIAAMTTGDFSGDGWVDLAIAEKDSSCAVVWLNDQTGRFTRGPVVSLAGTPLALTAADLTGDTRLELVASLAAGGGTLELFESDGGGGFTPPVTLPIGGTPAFLRVGDLDDDDRLDLVVSSSSATTVAVLLNQGALAFSTTHYAAGDSPQGVALVDFDHDGVQDLAVAGSGVGTAVVSVLIGAGDGTFAPRVEHPVNGTMHLSEIDAGDLDGDLQDDLVASFAIEGKVAVLWNDGAGSIGEQQQYELPSETIGGAKVLVADLDRDGLLDIAASDGRGYYGRSRLSLFLGIGGRAFDRSLSYCVGRDQHYSSGLKPRTFLGLADVDHLAGPDLVLGFNSIGPAAELLVIRHRAAALFDGLIDYNVAGGTGPIAPIDFNASGKDDLLMSRGGHLWHLPSDSNGRLGSPVDLGPGTLATTMDLNGDGRTDVLQNYGSPLAISICDATGHLLPPDTYPTQFHATGDFDGNGSIDILGQSAGTLETLFNDGTGHFDIPNPAIDAPVEGAVGVGDVDGDGRSDLVIAYKIYASGITMADSLSVYRGLGDGTFVFLADFALPRRFPGGNEYQRIERVLLSDLNRDHRIDAVIMTRFFAGPGVLYVLIGDGAGAFAGAALLDVVREDAEVALVDADGDLDPDLVVLAHTDEGVGQLQVFANRGNGTFSPGSVQGIPEYPGRPYLPGHGRPVVTGDFDADGSPDVAFPYGEINLPQGIAVFLGRFTDLPTPTLVSLVSATVSADGVRLVWHGATSSTARVHRRTGEAWTAMATVVPDGNGRYVFEDRDVEPGTRYGYRLQFGDGAQARHTEETLVDIPRAAALQFERPTPNPTIGTLRVSFTLPSGAPATLEMNDVAGRRVHSVTLASPDPGRHTIDLSGGARLSPGVYWVRLTQRTESVVTRFVLIR